MIIRMVYSTMPIRRWITQKLDDTSVLTLRKELNIGSLAAKVLVGRGYSNPVDARAFLFCDEMDWNPLARKDMRQAVERIHLALDQDEKIAIFGDYDADGLTATALMYRCLSAMGADVCCALPSREGTGYGLSQEMVDKLQDEGVSLIVTVDNGVSAFEEAEYIYNKGMQLVITDHHVVQDSLPRAEAVVNPHRPDDDSPNKDLAGVGVALELAAALEEISIREAIESYGILAAIGTIGDIMPLVGANRFIVAKGIEMFPGCDYPGLFALCEVTGIKPEEMKELDVAYTLAPRLNAAGRMGDAELALQLLLSEDEEDAVTIANQLEQINRQRQETELKSMELIQQHLSEKPSSVVEPVLIVSGKDFHPGVMGIACSRLVDRLDKPVIIISVDGDTAKGSGRSIRGFSLYKMIESCSDLLEKFGGHDMAAGFTLRAELIPTFKERIMDYCRTHAQDFTLPELRIDCEVELPEISEEEVAQLRLLAPFGSANAEPRFLLRHAVVDSIYPLGEKHTRVILRKGSETISVAYFGLSNDAFPFPIGEVVDTVLSLSIYHGPTRSMVSAKVISMSPSFVDKEEIDSYEEYRRFCFSGVVKEDSPLRCTREDAVKVYRRIQSGGLPFAKEGALCGQFGDMSLGKAMTIIAVFSELGFITFVEKEGASQIVTIPDAPKKDLMESSLFRAVVKQEE